MNHKIRNILFCALLAIGLGAQAADVKISALPAGSALAGTEAIPAVQAGATVKTTPAAIATYLLSGSATTEVLANNAGAVDGDAGFTYNATTDIATLSGGLGLGGSADVFIVRAAAGAASFRNGTTAQVVRVTDTYTDDSNGAYLELNAAAAGDWVQVRAVTNGTAGDNYGIALTPAGTGAISAQVPDSTDVGGNTRGLRAVDFQLLRATNSQVASGASSFIGNGSSNTASGSYAVVAGGLGNVASGPYAWVPGGSYGTTRGLDGAGAYASGRRSAVGDAQVILQPVRRTTTDGTPVSLATDGTPAATTVMVLPASSMMACEALVGMKYGADSAGYRLLAVFERDGSNNTSLVGSVTTTVIAEDAGLSGADATLVANDTLESAEIQVTGPAGTAYSVGELKCVQVL